MLTMYSELDNLIARYKIRI